MESAHEHHQREAVGASSKTNFLVFIWFHLGWPSLWVSFRARNSLCPHLLSCGQNCLLLRCFCCFCAASVLLLCAYDFLKAAPPPPPVGFPLRSLMPCASARPSLAPAAGCRPRVVARDMAGRCARAFENKKLCRDGGTLCERGWSQGFNA